MVYELIGDFIVVLVQKNPTLMVESLYFWIDHVNILASTLKYYPHLLVKNIIFSLLLQFSISIDFFLDVHAQPKKSPPLNRLFKGNI